MMVKSLKVFLIWLFVTWAGLQFHSVDSAGLTCASKKDIRDIEELILKWNEDSVVLNDKISTYATHKGTNTKKTYRLDNERPTADNFAKFRIQSGKETYGAVLIKPNVNFGKLKIREAFTESVKNCAITKLE